MRRVLILILLAWHGSAYGGSNADSLIALTSSNLPIVVINTHGQYIPDEPKIMAEMGIIDNGPGKRNNLTDPYNGYQGNIGIETRGSSSEQFPKKQYAVETRDSLGNDLSVSLLGLPAETDWVLSAPYSDKSLMRDPVMYMLARKLGRYASRFQYCELVLNGQYAGVYILLEKIKRDKNRVNIAKMSTADTTGDALSGGYIVKIDKTEGADIQGWYSGFAPYSGAWQQIFYQFHYPKQEDLAWPQRSYITRFIRDFEIAMYLPSFNDPATGYPHLLDVGSFVDFLLLNELGKNVDACRLSSFMYKERDSKGGKLFMGPVWDFNLAFGNANYYSASRIEGLQLSYMTDSLAFRQTDLYQPPFWWKKLFDDPSFREQLNERWGTLRKDELSLGSVISVIDSLTTLLGEAQQRNFLRWSVLGQYVWPNAYVGKTYQDEINYLKTWITNRLDWLDRQFTTTSSNEEAAKGEIPQGCTLRQNYPNPFNPNTMIEFTLPGDGFVELGIYDVLGREVARLVNGKKEAGKHTVTFDASRLASGAYVCRLVHTPQGAARTGVSVQTRKMLLLR